MKRKSTTALASLFGCLLSLQALSQRFIPIITDEDDIATHTLVTNRFPVDKHLSMEGIYFCGHYNDSPVWRWDGEQYHYYPLPEAFDGLCRPKRVLKYGTQLIVAGNIPFFNHIAVYQDEAWQSMGEGFSGGVVWDMAVYNGVLFACGNFSASGSTATHGVAFWNGQAWQAVGDGIIANPSESFTVMSMAVFNGKLHLAGTFESFGTESNHYAVWDGQSWAFPALESVGFVRKMQVHNNKLIFLTESVAGEGMVLVEYDGINTNVIHDNCPEDVNDFVWFAGEWRLNRKFQMATQIAEFYTIDSNGFTTINKRNLVSDLFYWNGNDYAIGRFHDFPHMTFGTAVADYSCNTIEYLSNPHTEALVGIKSTMFFNDAISRPHYRIKTHPFQNDPDLLPVTVYRAAPMLYAKNSDGEYQLSTDLTFEQIKFGPHSDNYDKDYLWKYMRVWHLTKQEVQNHINQWSNPGYQMPDAIKNWPGNGRVEYGESPHLAPFYDLNQNGWYEPHLGEYPMMRGDRMALVILHDSMQDEFATTPFDRVVTYYQFDSGSNAELNATYLNDRIINRSEVDYTEVKYGVFSDFDIGCANDDFVGCTPSLDMFYAYNSSPVDYACPGAIPFENDVPAQSVLFLSHPMTSFTNHFLPFSTSGPPAPIHFIQMMNGQTSTGDNMVWGGTGYSEEFGVGPGDDFSFVFPSNPWESGEGVWNAVSSGMLPHDVRGIGACESFALPAGAEACVDYVYLHAFGDQSFPFAEVQFLQESAQFIKGLWQSQEQICNLPVFPLSNPKVPGESKISLYPNPSTGVFNINGLSPKKRTFELYDLMGRLIHSHTSSDPSARIDISGQPDGLYVLVIRTEGGETHVLKPILQR